MTDAINKLIAEYTTYCDQHKLPSMSADELLFEPVASAHREYLTDFIERWDSAMETESKEKLS